MSMYDSTHKKSSKMLVLACLALSMAVGLFIDFLNGVPELPNYDEAMQWGCKNDSTIREFKIDISKDVLDDLNYRLTHARPFAPSFRNTNSQYGLNRKLLQEILDYWLNQYDWKTRENYLNQHPHFKTSIQGLDVHFVHVKGDENKQVIPLLLLHGWPSTFRDFYDIIPHLVNGHQNYSFELVIPSLPGYIFSEGSLQSGFGGPEYAMIFRNLMQRLGHEKFVVYGNDWGFTIASDLAVLFEDNVLGFYSPLCVSLRWISMFKYALESVLPDFVVGKENRSKYSTWRAVEVLTRETAYMHMHATKPDTLAASLQDSPIGFAAYVIQIMSAGTDVENMHKPDAGLNVFNYTDLLDNIMLYWVSNSIAPSVRSYTGLIRGLHKFHQKPIVKVPCSCPKFYNEIFHQNSWLVKDKYTNLVSSTRFEKGGHFFLLENDEELKQSLVRDIFASVKKMIEFNKDV